MPGDTIRYENDKLFINGEETNEPYLAEYLNLFKTEKLQNTYTGKGFEGNKEFTLENLLKKHKPLRLMSIPIPASALLSLKVSTFSLVTIV